MGAAQTVVEAKAMTIINLDQKRREAQEAATPDYAVCGCGEAWFELRNSDGVAPNGAVCLDADGGRIIAYTGHPHCIGCGEPYKVPFRRS